MTLGETDLKKILQSLKPTLHAGEYVFCCVNDLSMIDHTQIVLFFREQEGLTVIIKKELADKLQLGYSFIASWITLEVHSSLSAVGLTAAFSKALAENGISCNAVAAFYHDHLFIDKADSEKAMEVLRQLSE